MLSHIGHGGGELAADFNDLPVGLMNTGDVSRLRQETLRDLGSGHAGRARLHRANRNTYEGVAELLGESKNASCGPTFRVPALSNNRLHRPTWILFASLGA